MNLGKLWGPILSVVISSSSDRSNFSNFLSLPCFLALLQILMPTISSRHSLAVLGASALKVSLPLSGVPRSQAHNMTPHLGSSLRVRGAQE